MNDPSLAAQLLSAGAAHCSAAIEQHGGLIGSLFIAGLVGSASHCVGMCGPFVLSQTVARLEGVPASQMQEWHRLAGAALIPYHLGRATTYVALGTAAAVLAGGMIDLAGLRWLSTALLTAAALFFLVYALQALKLPLPRLSRTSDGSGAGWWSRVLGRRLQPLFARPVGWRGYALGLALGFLPCGLLYGAIAAASASGDAVGGALAMMAFTIGTVPALLAVGLAGHVAGSRWRAMALRVAPLIMLANAAALTYLAWRVVA